MAQTITLEVEPIVIDGLRKTKFGTPFQKDTEDLFCSLLVSLKLSTHKQMGFKVYRDSFLGHEAVQNLGSLKFIRSPDARDLSKLVPLSTRVAKLSEDSAMSLMQHFLDGSLIKDATTKTEGIFFKQKRIYQPTPKGLCVLEAFLQACDLDSELNRFAGIISSQPTPRLNLRRLERSVATDELILTQSNVRGLFRKFAGRRPNYNQKDETGVLMVPFHEKSKLLRDLFKKSRQPLGGKISSISATHCVTAPRIIHWLCDNSVISCPQEAAEMAAHFILQGLLVSVSDKAKRSENAPIFTATGPVARGSSIVTASAEFRYTHESVYAITDEGSLVAWNNSQLLGTRNSMAGDNLIQEAIALSLSTHESTRSLPSLKDEPSDLANAARLKTFVMQPSMLVLFRQFLGERQCEYNLAFWIDVEDFKAEFAKASKARPPPISGPPVAGSSKTPVMEPLPSTGSPLESLGNIPFMIYNTYLAPTSTCKLTFNIGDDLKKELETGLEHCVETLTNNILKSETEIFGPPTTLDIDQLAILVFLYERIQSRVFATLADQFVPEFLKWPKFLSSRLDSLASISEESSRRNEIDEESR